MTIQTGSKALLVYPAGDCDWVVVVALSEYTARVRTPSGRVLDVCIEDIGIGVDDDIRAITDDGTLLP